MFKVYLWLLLLLKSCHFRPKFNLQNGRITPSWPFHINSTPFNIFHTCNSKCLGLWVIPSCGRALLFSWYFLLAWKHLFSGIYGIGAFTHCYLCHRCIYLVLLTAWKHLFSAFYGTDTFIQCVMAWKHLFSAPCGMVVFICLMLCVLWGASIYSPDAVYVLISITSYFCIVVLSCSLLLLLYWIALLLLST